MALKEQEKKKKKLNSLVYLTECDSYPPPIANLFLHFYDTNHQALEMIKRKIVLRT